MEPEPSKVPESRPGPSRLPEPKPGPSRLPEPRPGPSRLPEPRPGPSRDPEPRPGPSRLPEPRPGPSRDPEPRPGPSRLPEPRPGPSRLPEPRPGPSRDPEPRPGPSRVPEPGPSRKSDEELLREHGIDRECRVVLSSDFILDHGDSLVPNKGFRVHYGRQFLFQIAQLSFRHPSAPLDMDRLYSTYITSRFSTLDRPNFKGILRSYFAQWEEECRKRRALLLKAKMDQVNARRKAEREARRRCKITYRNKSVIVPRGSIEQVKIALRNSSRSRVLLERIFVDDAPAGVTAAAGNPPADAVPVGSPQSATNVSESQCDTAPGSVSGDVEDSSELPGSSSSRSAISDSPPHFMYLGNEKKEDRRTAITGLITDLIAKVSDEQDHDGGASNPDMSSTDCYSDDTVESPMEVEFESGESPDFSKVLRDSEETCHGDDFYEVATANQQSLGNSNADKGSCVNQKTITRSHDKPSHKKSMKL